MSRGLCSGEYAGSIVLLLPLLPQSGRGRIALPAAPSSFSTLGTPVSSSRGHPGLGNGNGWEALPHCPFSSWRPWGSSCPLLSAHSLHCPAAPSLHRSGGEEQLLLPILSLTRVTLIWGRCGEPFLTRILSPPSPRTGRSGADTADAFPTLG